MSTALPVSLMSALAEESPDAALIVDEHCRIRYANKALEALCGYAEPALLGQPLDMLLPGETSACGPDDKVRAFTVRHKDGQSIPVEMKSLDLGQHDGGRYFGAFLEDLRPRRRIEQQTAELLGRLEQEAMTDALTGIANRRSFEAEAARMMARARRSGKPVTVGIADIDHFKRINDEHGHPAGDSVLRAIAGRIIDAARSTDFVARIGGEEFGLLFPETGVETAVRVAQRVREAIAAGRVQAEGCCEVGVTISIGLAAIKPGTPLEDGLAAADAALYAAKNGGRNRVEVA